MKGADYVVPHEIVDEDYPLHLTTGRVVFQFHTRTKTAHSRELNEAAPDAFIQLNGEDAERLGIEERDMLQIESRRGWAYAPARIGDIEPGHVFMPFHYGYWDNDERPRAVNEMTLYEWDPVSKQPYFKYAAVRLRKMQPGEPFEMDDPMRDEHLKEASENPGRMWPITSVCSTIARAPLLRRCSPWRKSIKPSRTLARYAKC